MLTSRSYAGEDDYARIRALLRACYAAGPVVYCTVGDLDWWRAGDAPEPPSARLWFDGAELAGVAWPAKTQVDIFSRPGYQWAEGEMLTWAEEQHRAASAPEPPLAFSAWSYAGDVARVALLEARGYRRGEMALNQLGMPVPDDVPEPAVPPGYAVRSVHGPEEVEARVAVHRDAFAPSRMTATYYGAATALPTYRRDLDLVVQAPDGSLAAFCIVWHDEVSRMGVFEPVGCHSAHRRLGLTRAVMREGLRRLRALGARHAYVCCLSTNHAAAGLYESVGFTHLDANQRWQKSFS
jgi:GNAT superfamily N-acetyltransferase